MTVAGVSVLPSLVAGDLALASTRPWAFRSLPASRSLIARTLRGLSVRLLGLGLINRHLLFWSEGPAARSVRRHLSEVPCDLLVLSNLPSFAAFSAAPGSGPLRVWTDLEDDHVAMLPDQKGFHPERRRRELLVRAATNRAERILAASPLMAQGLSNRYHRPVDCILNVFDVPLAALPTAPSPALLWQSQTVGPERGLEDILRVFAHMPSPPRLCLRGMVSDSYRLTLTNLLTSLGLPSETIEFLPYCAPQDLLANTRGYRAGLALECAPDENRRNCLTNKIFEYLAAGVPIVLSDTPAHRALLPELGASSVLIDLRQPEAAARRLSDWLSADRDTQQRAAEALAETRFNWQLESRRLVEGLKPTVKPSMEYPCAS
ncbi:MAG: hypothetical protein IPK97_06860 [Ahniella sp.]|nr:hypothetical protein [Ahniella sp.]